MEDVLDLYQQPYDPERPVVCMDEQPKQLVRETRVPLRTGRGRPARSDYEYERAGTANIFMFVEPLAGTRKAQVTQQRTRQDWALAVKRLCDEDYPTADVIRLVVDNLNTHSISSLYEAFPPDEARRLAMRLELHYTPKHGSWLNIAEMEFAALTKQCVGCRVADIASLRAKVKAWETARNAAQVEVDWQFTTTDARIKLKRLYPRI